jgi:hypothetical protein
VRAANHKILVDRAFEDMNTVTANGLSGYGLYEENALKAACTKYSILGRDGPVIGSEFPWVESILFAHGARNITTIEYGTIESHVHNHTM